MLAWRLGIVMVGGVGDSDGVEVSDSVGMRSFLL